MGVSRPFGTKFASDGNPNVETLGYYRMSLRDGDSVNAKLDQSFGCCCGG